MNAFQSLVMTNDDVLRNLLIAHPDEPLQVPTHVLLDWLNTIPSPETHAEARAAYIKRRPKHARFFDENPHTPGSPADHARG